VILFLIIFLWTPPHFWALALLKSDDYSRANVPMLPVVAGLDETRRQIMLYTLLLVPVGIAPWPLGYTGALYGVVAVAAGAVMAALAFRVWRERGAAAPAAARKLFAFSLLYLFALFAALLADNGLSRLGLGL
jgi:protoheme IX farnesyltransferase